jgi:SWI/SNF-related matrix-associated actin-dependent regulator 1 of chromatin subfamily A
MTALRKLAAIGKVQAATQWIGEFLDSTARPLVVMSWHNEVHQAIAAAVDEMNALVGTNDQVVYRKIRYGFVTGEQSFAQRQKTIDQFQAGELDLCIYGIPLATGTTLTRAQDVVFVERAWRPADLVQAEDRIHRIGQKNDCLVTYLDAVGTIDASIAALLADKVATAAGVIDGEDLSDADAASRVLGDLFKADDSAKPTKRTSRTKTTKNPARETIAYNWDEPLLP